MAFMVGLKDKRSEYYDPAFNITGSINAIVVNQGINRIVSKQKYNEGEIDTTVNVVKGGAVTDSNASSFRLPASMNTDVNKPIEQHKVPSSDTKPIEHQHKVPTEIIISQSASDLDTDMPIPDNGNIDNTEDNTEDELSKENLKMSIPRKPKRSLSLYCAIVLPAAPLCSDRIFH